MWLVGGGSNDRRVDGGGGRWRSGDPAGDIVGAPGIRHGTAGRRRPHDHVAIAEALDGRSRWMETSRTRSTSRARMRLPPIVGCRRRMDRFDSRTVVGTRGRRVGRLRDDGVGGDRAVVTSFSRIRWASGFMVGDDTATGESWWGGCGMGGWMMWGCGGEGGWEGFGIWSRGRARMVWFVLLSQLVRRCALPGYYRVCTFAAENSVGFGVVGEGGSGIRRHRGVWGGSRRWGGDGVEVASERTAQPQGLRAVSSRGVQRVFGPTPALRQGTRRDGEG